VDHSEATHLHDKLSIQLKVLNRRSHHLSAADSWLFPQLDEAEIAAFGKGDRMIAPPTFVVGAYWQVQRIGMEIRLTPMRHPSSFRADAPAHSCAPMDILTQHVDKALDFAQNWRSQLVEDEAQDAVVASLCFPDDNKPAASVYAWLSQPYSKLRNDGAFNHVVTLATSDELHGLEMAGLTPTHLLYCACCYFPIDKGRCQNCTAEFPRICHLLDPHKKAALGMPDKLVEQFSDIVF